MVRMEKLESLHWRGIEPLTARFVAGYSIQLSYQCGRIDDIAIKVLFLQALMIVLDKLFA